ncbi:hypothetical protein HK100_011694, partial [Physocladia obscura]
GSLAKTSAIATVTTTTVGSTSSTTAASSSSRSVPTSSQFASTTSTTAKNANPNSIDDATSTTTTDSRTPKSSITTATTTTSSDSSNGSSIPIGAIAGGIAGVVVVALFVFFLVKRSQRKKRRENLELNWVSQSGYMPTPSTRATPSLPNSAFNHEKPVTLGKLEHAPTRSKLAAAAPELSQKDAFSAKPQHYYQQLELAPMPRNASVFTITTVATAAGSQSVQDPALIAAYYAQQQQQSVSYQHGPTAGQYPGYYDDQGQYHYYTAEQIAQMLPAPPIFIKKETVHEMFIRLAVLRLEILEWSQGYVISEQHHETEEPSGSTFRTQDFRPTICCYFR